MNSFDGLLDMEVVAFFDLHIRNPCEVNVNGDIHNIRYFYLNMARENLSKLTNPFAVDYLKGLIEEFS